MVLLGAEVDEHLLVILFHLGSQLVLAPLVLCQPDLELKGAIPAISRELDSSLHRIGRWDRVAPLPIRIGRAAPIRIGRAAPRPSRGGNYLRGILLIITRSCFPLPLPGFLCLFLPDSLIGSERGGVTEQARAVGIVTGSIISSTLSSGPESLLRTFVSVSG